MSKKPKKNPPSTKSLQKRKAPRKGGQNEIADRRQEVMRLRMAGKGYRAIAKELGVGHMTVKRDLEAIRAETDTKISQFHRDHMLAESVSVYEQIEMEAWLQYHATSTGAAQKARFLDVVRGARGDQISMLTDLGFLKKAPTEHTHRVSTEVISHWTTDAQDIVALALVRGMTSPAVEPTRDVIETVAVPALTDGGNGVNHPDPKSEGDEEEAA